MRPTDRRSPGGIASAMGALLLVAECLFRAARSRSLSHAGPQPMGLISVGPIFSDRSVHDVARTDGHPFGFEDVLSKTRKLMTEHPELASAMLAIALAAVLQLTGQLYMEHRAMRDARNPTAAWTRQADVRQGPDIRLVSERSPFMRSER